MTSSEHSDNGAPHGERSAPSQAGEYPAIADDLFCTKCGYNLRGLTSNRCPECGYSFEELRSAVSGIPWVHRRHLGWFRAYWKTVWLVTAREKRFCAEIVRPVDYADSQSFRWITILHVYLPILVGTIALYAVEPTGPFGDPSLNAGFVAVWPAVVFHILLVVYLAAATGVPSYFFHPRSLPVHLQNRAIALSYYACGPLALAGLCVGSALASIAIHAGVFDGNNLAAQLLVLAFGLLATLFAAGWWSLLVEMAKRIFSRSRRWKIAIAIGVPALWVILMGLVFVVVPFLIFCVTTVVRSLE